MKKLLLPVLIICSLSVSATPSNKKKNSQFTGDLNGDGYTDLVIADRTNYRDSWGFVKVFYGNASGFDTLAGWSYDCNLDNFLESQYLVSIINDVNGDGTDELCMLLTNLSNKKSGRSHQDIFLFYGKRTGLTNAPTILKLEQNNKDKISIRNYLDFDYDGDGFTDILAVSSKRNYQPLETSWMDVDKKLILFSGSDTGIIANYKPLRDVDDIVLKYGGDVNGDGFNDMLIAEQNKKDLVWTQFFGNKNKQQISKPFLTYKLPGAFSTDRIYSNIAWDFNGDKYDDDYTMHEDASSLFKKPDSVLYTLDFYPGSRNGLKDTIVYSWKMKTAPGIRLNITSCADLNNDGFGDFILQIFTPKLKEAPRMEANILWGKKEGVSLDTTSYFDELFHSLYLVSYGFTSVNALGDVNNDGYADVLLGVETVVYGNKDGNFKPVRLHFLE